MAFDPSRLYAQLLNTGLQTKDNALYQVIYQLIGAVAELRAGTTAGTSTGGGSSSTGLTEPEVAARVASNA